MGNPDVPADTVTEKYTVGIEESQKEKEFYEAFCKVDAMNSDTASKNAGGDIVSYKMIISSDPYDLFVPDKNMNVNISATVKMETGRACAGDQTDKVLQAEIRKAS